jgi:hypothetical protein
MLACAPLAPFEFAHFFLFLFLQHLSRGSTNMLVLQVELTWAQEVENVVTLASTHEDAKGLVWKVILLESELAEVCQAREVVEEKFYRLSDAATDGA